MRAQATEALWQWVLGNLRERDWEDIDGFELMHKAAELGLVRKEKYDPAVHGEDHDLEPGDPLYIPVT